jgi:hypothetical protein
VTGKPRPRRVALLDRPWLSHHSVVLATPLVAPSAARIRELLAEFLLRHPEAPLACRVDAGSGRWLPVPAAGREAHLDRVLVTADDPGDLAEHVTAHQASFAADLPVVVVATPTSLMVRINHAAGDAVTLTQLLLALAQAGPGGLEALAHRAGTKAPVQGLLGELRAHHRDWTGYLRHRSAPPAGTVTGPPAPLRPSFAGTIVSNSALRDITRWRNTHAKGVSLTCVLTTLVHRALERSGVPMDGTGFYTLIDMRPLLPATPELRLGNLAKSLYLAADLTDPHSVGAALKEVQDTQRALPAAVIGAFTSALSRPHQPPEALPPVSPVTLTFNSMPGLPGIADLPWAEGANKRFYGFGPSLGPGGVTVFAIRLREHTELTATFDEASASRDVVRGALEMVADPAALLADLTSAP